MLCRLFVHPERAWLSSQSARHRKLASKMVENWPKSTRELAIALDVLVEIPFSFRSRFRASTFGPQPDILIPISTGLEHNTQDQRWTLTPQQSRNITRLLTASYTSEMSPWTPPVRKSPRVSIFASARDRVRSITNALMSPLTDMEDSTFW